MADPIKGVLIRDHCVRDELYEAGTQLILHKGHDYGIARDDTYGFGEPHSCWRPKADDDFFVSLPDRLIEVDGKPWCGEYG